MNNEPKSIITAAPSLLWELSHGPAATYLPKAPKINLPEGLARKKPAALPEHTELQVLRHFKALAQANFSIERNMYPLGSCTMKYNPKPAEEIASRPAFFSGHPYGSDAPGLGVIAGLQEYLGKLTGLPGVSLQPAAGAQGELAGVLMIRAALAARGELEQRRFIIIPDSAHGTNPATTTMAGFSTITVKTGPKGRIEPESIVPHLGPQLAGIMITNPNTLGLFEDNIREIAEMIHKAGGYVYGDGANFNAIAGVIKPGDLGIDVMHINVHKTFGTPHGGGGPGAGPVCVTPELTPFLPGPLVRKNDSGGYEVYQPGKSMGRLRLAFGNFGILLRAYSYLLYHGPEGIRNNSVQAVLSANYLMKRLEKVFPAAYPGVCMHEYVSGNPLAAKGVHTMDIAKRLLDYGVHAPTVYFPLIVKEALMMEPTESESLEEIDNFITIMTQITIEAENDPELVTKAPHSLPLGRVDEVLANRQLVLKHELS